MSIIKTGRRWRMCCDVVGCITTQQSPDFMSREQALEYFADFFHQTRCSGFHFCRECTDRILEAELKHGPQKLNVCPEGKP